MAQGMTPEVMPENVRHPNPDVNLGEMYGGIPAEAFVQLRFNHDNDGDDIVPELTENLVIEHKAKAADTRKTDF